jgi:hypothetical protein
MTVERYSAVCRGQPDRIIVDLAWLRKREIPAACILRRNIPHQHSYAILRKTLRFLCTFGPLPPAALFSDLGKGGLELVLCCTD